MTRRLSTSRSGRTQSTWPLVLLLLVAVAVPATCVLWFMTEAMRNEQLAVRGRLTALYEGQLDTLARRLDDFWEQKQAALAAVNRRNATAAETFAELVRSDVADSVIVYAAPGYVTYPVDAKMDSADQPSNEGEWLQAWKLEYENSDYVAAAEAYAGIAGDASEDHNRAARSLWAQARCLVKADQKQAALEILTGELATTHGDATDTHGNLILPGAQLWAMEKIAEPDSDEYREILQALVERLDNYGDPVLPADQRRFLTQQLREVSSDSVVLPTFEAEVLAAEYLKHLESHPRPTGHGSLAHTGLDDVWELAAPDNTVPVALFKQDRLLQEMQSVIESESSLLDAQVRLLLPNNEVSTFDALMTSPAGRFLSAWQLTLRFNDPDPFATAENNRIALYLYSGTIVVLGMIALAALVARYVSGQIRVTRLRNDLIATVSHELKTPLASIRVLIDTLLEGRYHDEAQHREYLQLAAKENERLSRLIDNFLSFSRMERNKRTFEFSSVGVHAIVSAAKDALNEEFQSSGAQFDVELGSDLPKIRGDADALTTVLIDLLDNANKYTGDEKHIILRASAQNGTIRLEVQDNGVGMSRRAAKKVFDRYYQVDETLSRRTGGCGLGLSIVQFIVTSHGGSVSVSSQPGKGSTFAVILPAADEPTAEDQ